MTNPESLRFFPLPEDTLEAARHACESAVRRRASERGREVEGWAVLADAGISARTATGERWLRLLAGDSTTWFWGGDEFSTEVIIGAAEEFGEMLAEDLLPLD